MKLKINKDNYLNGLYAEKIAADYLISLGYNIIGQRWKSKFGEIDIIALKSDLLLFVEVKARKYYPKDQIVCTKQQKRNSLAALDFLSKIESLDFNILVEKIDIRYDCIIVINQIVVAHLQNAWYIES